MNWQILVSSLYVAGAVCFTAGAVIQPVDAAAMSAANVKGGTD